MNKKVLIAVAAAAVIIVAGVAVYGYLYKDARNISNEKAFCSVSAENLTADYEAEQPKADAKYLNKAIEVTGVVTAVADSVITLNDKVFCSFDKKMSEPEGKQITIKGRCIGYDELFGEVKLDQCVLK